MEFELNISLEQMRALRSMAQRGLSKENISGLTVFSLRQIEYIFNNWVHLWAKAEKAEANK